MEQQNNKNQQVATENPVKDDDFLLTQEEVEYFKTIKPGDVITISRQTTDVKQRFMKSLDREVVIETLEQSFSNQLGELVATHKSTNLKILPKT